MRKNCKEFHIEKMAEVLCVSRTGYYDFLRKGKSKRAKENENLKEKIRKIHKGSRGTYGSPRIHRELEKQGERCSRRRVAKLMKEEEIQAKMRKKWTKTTSINKKAELSPNHLNQNFTVESPDKVWVSDITYIPTQEGWLYLAVVMDLFSRKIIGFSMEATLETELVMKAVKQALFRRNAKGVIHHSDKGCQYTSREFRELAKRHGIIQSMSGTGNCYDNAVAESFFHTLKTEHTNFYNYRIREEAKNSIFEYIEVFYNRKRSHSTNGYLSPEDYEKAWKVSREHAA